MTDKRDNSEHQINARPRSELMTADTGDTVELMDGTRCLVSMNPRDGIWMVVEEEGVESEHIQPGGMVMVVDIRGIVQRAGAGG